MGKKGKGDVKSKKAGKKDRSKSRSDHTPTKRKPSKKKESLDA